MLTNVSGLLLVVDNNTFFTKSIFYLIDIFVYAHKLQCTRNGQVLYLGLQHGHTQNSLLYVPITFKYNL